MKAFDFQARKVLKAAHQVPGESGDNLAGSSTVKTALC